ncbi:hypothetical protein AN2V17_11760 [Vallitalea sp. AN17-2]|uniref:Uncharacterized protein n=1 Tax=Vallitalea maricola TaxID=3074433 RepID=A0ACB5UG87_9FIRM|nr:hypothetical protein AN2V17_11760 [Vallitalea sp. AN17-2]
MPTVGIHMQEVLKPTNEIVESFQILKLQCLCQQLILLLVLFYIDAPYVY